MPYDPDAVTGDDALYEFQKQVEAVIARPPYNPWCGICGAKRNTWFYEDGRTRFHTMAEAIGPLTESAKAQAATREFLKRSKN